jgi:hypothetical protein
VLLLLLLLPLLGRITTRRRPQQVGVAVPVLRFSSGRKSLVASANSVVVLVTVEGSITHFAVASVVATTASSARIIIFLVGKAFRRCC